MIIFACLPAFSFDHRIVASESTEYKQYFNSAYENYPEIPRGVLEAVSFSYTRLQHHDYNESSPKSCSGVPRTYGIMGLTENGKGYFKNNLKYVAVLSGISKQELMTDPELAIFGYAKAYSALLKKSSDKGWVKHANVLRTLSELPQNTIQQDFALNSQLYVMFWFLQQEEFQSRFGFPNHEIDLSALFGKENYKVLSARNVSISDEGIKSSGGSNYSKVSRHCSDYPGSIWVAADPSNFSSRAGTSISAITIHDIEGTYAGAISWFQNPISNVSAHYCLRSIDGQVTQMVCESDKAWHVGTENPYTVGLEHEGKADYEGWYTEAMYQSSASVCLNTMNNYGIDPLRSHQGPPEYGINILGSCIKLKGHQHFSGTSHRDPGLNWDWAYFYRLLNDGTTPSPISITSSSGTIHDSGGASGNYGDDERLYWLIEPPGATSVTISFTSFDLELNWDYMYLYDGNSVYDDLIGVYTGTSTPGTITAESGSVLIEFRSDCATTNPGWTASYTSSTAPLSCPVPSGLYQTGILPVSASLHWSGSAANYLLRYRDHTYNPWSYLTVADTLEVLTGLSSNSEYYWGVASICGTDTSSFAGSMFTTPAISTPFTISKCDGTFRDSGGPMGVYMNSEDYTCTIDATGPITMSFASFAIENSYDFLYVYDGPTTASPQIIGSPFTGLVGPGSFTSSGNSITFRFTSDNRTTDSGWEAEWNCTPPGPSIPTASFTTSSTTICYGDSIQLVNTSVDADTYNWVIPGASPTTSSQTDPWVLFATSGSYSIELIASGAGGSDTLMQTVNVTVLPNPAASFTENADTLFVPSATLYLTNTSTDASTYYWDFGDGSSSTDVNPWHNYSTPGQYTVLLVAYSSSCGNDSAFLTVEVFSAADIHEEQIVDFQISPNPTIGETSITLNSRYSGHSELILTDTEGRIIRVKPLQLQPGKNTFLIDFNELGLAAGNYFLRLSTNSSQTTRPIVFRK